MRIKTCYKESKNPYVQKKCLFFDFMTVFKRRSSRKLPLKFNFTGAIKYFMDFLLIMKSSCEFGVFEKFIRTGNNVNYNQQLNFNSVTMS